MEDQLFIPEKIKVGYQNRSDTYTKKLAYVIYYDKKGVLRKEQSWQGWRDKKITADDFNNVPTEGFVLNKGVGGARQSYGWNTRNEYIRVFDPRNFEFEISVANLLFILQECTSVKGKGLEGTFVYAWSGKELVLLPTCSLEYQNSAAYTSLQSDKVSAKDMMPGCSYLTKKQETWLYLGKFDYYNYTYTYSNGRHYGLAVSKQHIFINETNKTKSNQYELASGFTRLAKRLTDAPVSNFAELAEKYYKSKHGSKPVGIELKEKSIDPILSKINKPSNANDYGYYYNLEKIFIKDNENIKLIDIHPETKYDNNERKHIVTDNYLITDNELIMFKNDVLYSTTPNRYGDPVSMEKVKEYIVVELYILLESGSKIKYEQYKN